MTEHEPDNEWFLSDPQIAAHGPAPVGETADSERPLEPWLDALVSDAMHVSDSEVPREMMWARVRRSRPPIAAPTRAQRAAPARRFGIMRPMHTRVLAIAATLAVGVAIGRYAQPLAERLTARDAGTTAMVESQNADASQAGLAAARASDPAVVAMEEHLAHTVALLTTVRDENPDVGPGVDVSGWARKLLGTTRLLLDEPRLRDEGTRRLLQDLELVLVQIIQARGTTAPEAKRAPSETMRETNLLPRVRAAVTAAVTYDEPSFRGIAE